MLCQYVFNLARYDENYDIRDRARFLKPFIFPTDGKETILSKNARKIFLASKPAPQLESKYHGREQFQLGSLSHYLNIRANGYHDLPLFPKEAPDPTVREVGNNKLDEIENKYYDEGGKQNEEYTKLKQKQNDKDNNLFYSESEKSTENDSESSGSGASDNDTDENGDDDESGTSDDESDATESSESASDDSNESNANTSESTTNESSEESSSKSVPKNKLELMKTAKQLQQQPQQKQISTKKLANRSNLDLLLDLDDISPSGPIMTPSFGGFLSPITNSTNPSSAASVASSRFELVGPSFIPMKKHELLNKINGHGLQIFYRFTRSPHLFSAKMVSIELTFKNDSNKDLESIHVGDKSTIGNGMQLNDFAPIVKLSPGQSVQSILGVDFNDSTQSINFEIVMKEGVARVSLRANIGEMIRSISITENVFRDEQSRLCGMNEHNASIPMNDTMTLSIIRGKIFDVANVAALSPTCNLQNLLFAGQTMASQSLVLISIALNDDASKVDVTVNCEKMVVGSMLLNEIKAALKF